MKCHLSLSDIERLDLYQAASITATMGVPKTAHHRALLMGDKWLTRGIEEETPVMGSGGAEGAGSTEAVYDRNQ